MNVAAVLVFLLVAAQSCCASRPPVVVLPDMQGAVVKLTNAPPQGGVSYRITHWPDGEQLATDSIPSASIGEDRCGLWAFEVKGLKPNLWSPRDPQLYEMEISTGDGQPIGKARFGFRRFEIRGRKFYLNGKPVLLKGMPINPPGRDLPPDSAKDPTFIRDYLRLVKSANVNIVRTETQEWLDACDEVGLMVFQGCYGGAPGGIDGQPPTFEAAREPYRDIALNLANHPSVVIYVLTNEVDYKDAPYKEFLTRVREDIRLLDPTRPVIGNAGFGKGEPGEIYDIHHYLGWYAGNLCDWYDLNDTLKLSDAAGKPLTITECVGAYTSDAGTFLTMSKQMATMIRWTGPVEDQRAAALEYQAELTRQIVESARRTRTASGGVAGVMPFSYYLGWASAHRIEDVIRKPAFEALKDAFEPVFVSVECWKRNLYAGDQLRMRLCVANDDEEQRTLSAPVAVIEVVGADDKPVASGEAAFATIRYYSNAWADVSIPIPASAPRGDYRVKVSLSDGGRDLCTTSYGITIAPRDWAGAAGIKAALFDPSGKTAAALKALDVEVESLHSLAKLPKDGLLIIGEEALDAGSAPRGDDVLSFLQRGGRILCLRQDRERWTTDWLPVKLTSGQRRPYRPLTYVHPVGGNEALFEGIRDRDLRYWNELGRAANGTPDIAPVLTPLRPVSHADLKTMRIWAACDRMLSGAAVAEVFHGFGSVILSQLRCAERVESDPIAARMLANLVRYASSLERDTGLVDLSTPVRWGIEAIRDGALSSPVQGFLLHSKTYQHRGTSKGRLGDDHSVDGVTLVGEYTHSVNGWIQLDTNVTEGWGVVHGKLSKKASKLVAVVRNPENDPLRVGVSIDGSDGGAVEVAPGATRSVEWRVDREPGRLTVEFRGDRRLVLIESRFE